MSGEPHDIPPDDDSDQDLSNRDLADEVSAWAARLTTETPAGPALNGAAEANEIPEDTEAGVSDEADEADEPDEPDEPDETGEPAEDGAAPTAGVPTEPPAAEAAEAADEDTADADEGTADAEAAAAEAAEEDTADADEGAEHTEIADTLAAEGEATRERADRTEATDSTDSAEATDSADEGAEDAEIADTLAAGGEATRESAASAEATDSAEVDGESGVTSEAEVGEFEGIGATLEAGTGDEISDEVGHVDGEPAPDLAAALEAVLMVVDEPIPTVQFAQVLETPRVEVEATLHRLAEEYTAAGRGFDLREVAGGWRFYSRTECAPVVERFILDGQQARLTQAALETLAVVAYRQPVSRARVAAIRGVNCDGVVRTLVSRGLIEEAGTEQESNALLYRTTTLFLERLGLQSVDDLPDIAPYLPEVDEFADTEDVPG